MGDVDEVKEEMVVEQLVISILTVSVAYSLVRAAVGFTPVDKAYCLHFLIFWASDFSAWLSSVIDENLCRFRVVGLV